MASMYCSIASCSVVVCVTENKSISVSDVMLITLYDMAGKMATGLRTLLRSFWRRLKTKYRNRRLMVDVAKALDEGVMLWGGCMKHSVPRSTLHRKSTTFVPPTSGPRRTGASVRPD